ncbi:hypothetical protein DIE16_31760 [Burkholderia sp. Bp9090]|uniref:hypothetical protein n=1 Tax=Burkholderia sp. Bp9090 TaxID=2184567 RepID=UPI000F5EE082|nr:hypothetical protein [Burkholderia sp. Bp9090]RQZ27407.1 hypothetical protein DIE16_31760 [Burkholderia sp. Bp9090]
MIEYVSDALLATLFPPGVGGVDLLRVAGPVAVDAGTEASGINFAGTRHLVFFADVMTYAGHDEQYIQDTAVAWNGGFVPAPQSRLVKFFRAEANQETMFYPSEWPLPDPAMIWQFSEALVVALIGHADAFPETTQYFYMPQTGKLDALYNRLARKFERGEFGVSFRCVTRPASDEGGFYGFERI